MKANSYQQSSEHKKQITEDICVNWKLWGQNAKCLKRIHTYFSSVCQPCRTDIVNDQGQNEGDHYSYDKKLKILTS